MKSVIKLSCLLLSMCLVIRADSVQGGAFENYVRRNIPSGHTMSSFVETCEGCGGLFGKDYTYKCLTDKSMRTFEGCYVSLNSRR